MTETANIEWNDELGMILDSAREFCKKHSDIATVRSLLESEDGFDPGVWQQIGELGWCGIALPESVGGYNLGVGALIPVAEMMGRNLLSTPFFSTVMASQAILRGADPTQQERWLPRLAGGTCATLALLGSEDWGDPELHVTATRQGDEWELQGRKWLVHDAGVAELIIVSADDGGKPALFIVEKSAIPAAQIQPQRLIDESKRASSIRFDGVRIANAQRLNGDAAAVLRDLQLIGALLTAAEATGNCAASLDCTVEYLKTRKQFGKLIGSYQALKHPTVDILCAMDSARSLMYHAASLIGDATLDKKAEIACRMTKAQASEALSYAGDRGIQFHGGMGFTYECDAQLYLRRSLWSRQHFGDPAHHRKRLAPLLLD